MRGVLGHDTQRGIAGFATLTTVGDLEAQAG